MALIKVNYFSKSLMRTVDFNLILPNDSNEDVVKDNEHYNREMKTLYLLHGFGGDCNDWLYNSLAKELSAKYNLAIVLPSGENSFYIDGKGTGKLYGEFTGRELVEYNRKSFGLSDKKKDTFIGGLSMGGYGALHNALKYSDTFDKVFTLSSALLINEIKNQKEGFKNIVADYDYYVSTFGDLTKLEESESNPEYLIKNMKKENKKVPSLFMACGTEDFLLERNREFHEFLLKEDIEVTYKETEGTHDWNFWNEHLEEAVIWLLNDR